MADYYSIRRDKTIREAEGYLELAMGFCEHLEPTPEIRDRFATRVLDLLSWLDDFDECRSRILYLRGQALRTLQRFWAAIPPLEKSAGLCPKNIHVWLSLGWCYKRVGRLDRAIESLEEALTVDPEQAVVHYNLACYWSLAGNPQLALAYLASSFEIDPSYRDLVDEETDFDTIREHPNFRELTSVIV